MKIAIMQPYFLPYIGYFQLMDKVDLMVLYDNIEYTKKGWINRNRILVGGEVKYVTIPIKNGCDHGDIQDRVVADMWDKDREKLLRSIATPYAKHPSYSSVMPMVMEILNFPAGAKLSDVVINSVGIVKEYLGITTQLVVSSRIYNGHRQLRGEDKVLSICKYYGADTYVNPPGGVHLYNPDNFEKAGVELQFIEPDTSPYPQLNRTHVPCLSILDGMMCNSKEYMRCAVKKGRLWKKNSS